MRFSALHAVTRRYTPLHVVTCRYSAFSDAMAARGLGSVFATEVLESLSSVHVLTTKWVDGERLASSAESDVPRLCGVALNAYLTMLLDTG